MPDLLSYADADRLIKYDRETGKLFWLPRPKEMFISHLGAGAWEKKFAGQEAFTSYSGQGYRVGRIMGRKCYAHRLIWLLETGEWPDVEIDHINGVRDDNRIGNLRLASRTVNMQNVCRSTRNTSGTTGVSFHKREGKWSAQIMVNRRRVSLGQYTNLEEAVLAREAANLKYGYSTRHGASSSTS